LAVLIAAGPAAARQPARTSRIPDGRITELVSVNEAAARALAFINAVGGDDGSALDTADDSTRGWYLDGKVWYWYGTPTVSETEDVYFGFYDISAQATDQAAYDTPFDLVSTPAGSDRGESHDGGHYVRSDGRWVWSTQPRDPDGGALGYDSIGQQGCAKNVLTIGDANRTARRAAKGAGAAKRGLGAWGPTDDGRIKPDIVANGAAFFAPGGGLLIQHYRATHGDAEMLSATLKGLVIHTADEAGDFDGPDYRSGWGKLSVSTASQHITVDTTDPDAIQELYLPDGGLIEQAWTADGRTPIKATICWTDPAGTPPTVSLDPTTTMLVNDLDLRIIGPGNTVYEPWVLNPANPDSPATRGDNARDNVEVVMIDAPAAGVYRLQITHKGTLGDGGQDVALILSRVDMGPPCGPDEVLDCNGKCAPAAWLADGVCDDGARIYNGNLIDFSCADRDDGDDCVLVEDTPPFILWRNTFTSRHVLWFMDGPTVLPETGVLPAMPSADWHVVGTGDFDGDGRADLFWRDAATGQSRIWFMTGMSLVPDPRVTTTANTAWTVVATEDFDGDGRADILWRNRYDGGTAMWFMDGATVRPETGQLRTVGDLSWQVVGTGDFDGDGFRDVPWRHAVTWKNVIWFLQGTSLTQTGALTTPACLDWKVVAADQ